MELRITRAASMKMFSEIAADLIGMDSELLAVAKPYGHGHGRLDHTTLADMSWKKPGDPSFSNTLSEGPWCMSDGHLIILRDVTTDIKTLTKEETKRGSTRA
eukprot:TRINITY_DN3933_c0_g1_i1.p2 TRINITY_DN3933_c0_g1~~TRINITY_DN3933_c0_g1_i1.p2  ORF type:complete len:102 (+),score=14.52 TRINITY_DN3933_c0_g1_i1:391-696(+)